MREIWRPALSGVAPSTESLLRRAGIGVGHEPTTGATGLARRAGELLARHAAPVAIVREVTAAEFERVYRGEDRNESPAPLETLHLRAERLGLFAATLGQEVGEEIAALFATGDFPLGFLLDAAASAAAENVAREVARLFLASLLDRGTIGVGRTALDYSPGYCGWHVSGQRRLFEALAPEEIGVRLNDSYLMRPLKSVSGVILVGPAGMHRIERTYPCCASCADRRCDERGASPLTIGAE